MFEKRPRTSFQAYSSPKDEGQIDRLKYINLIPKIKIHNT